MTEPPAHGRFPKGALLGAAALILVALVSAGAARITGVGRLETPPARAVESRELRFEDRESGAVAVYDAEADALVERLPPGTNGFLRGVLRGLSRDRKLAGIGREPPFRLTRWADGRLSLSDPTTGRTIDLAPFGKGNIAVFKRLLTEEPTR